MNKTEFEKRLLSKLNHLKPSNKITFSRFTIRIELHDVNVKESHYDILHEEMSNSGFNKTITSNSNLKYELPRAEYTFKGLYTSKMVLDLARKAAAKTELDYSVLVIKSIERVWYNLKENTK